MLGHWIVGIWSWSINWTHAIAKVCIYPGLDVRPCLLSLGKINGGQKPGIYVTLSWGTTTTTTTIPRPARQEKYSILPEFEVLWNTLTAWAVQRMVVVVVVPHESVT